MRTMGVGVLDGTAQIFFFAKNATQRLRHAAVRKPADRPVAFDRGAPQAPRRR